MDPDLTDAETGAMFRAFFNLTAHWGLDDRESRILLGEPAVRTYNRWKSDQFAPSPISRDTRERLSVLNDPQEAETKSSVRRAPVEHC
ncbi:MAG: hypothetical protein OXC31_23720 [Spirochaetaceae bacterium]|nr:hypothetical protein [Spirochaetaceae bacterium]